MGWNDWKSAVVDKSRLWCFTCYDLEFNFQALIDSGKAKYIITGLEIAPTTGREHLQGFAYFPRERSSVKQTSRDLGKSAVFKCKGNLEQNCSYCSKDENVTEYGVKPKQGFRTDLEAIKDDILGGVVTCDDICVINPNMFHQYGRTLNKLEDIALRRKFRSWMTEGIWYFGPSGSGKSHMAFKDYDPASHYVFPNDGGWWDGYTGQETVIINEFRGGIAYSELLDLLDKYPKTVRRRCREPVPFLAKRVIITSVLQPKEVYNNLAENDSLAQLYRRVTLFFLEQKWSEGNIEPSALVPWEPNNVIWAPDD